VGSVGVDLSAYYVERELNMFIVLIIVVCAILSLGTLWRHEERAIAQWMADSWPMRIWKFFALVGIVCFVVYAIGSHTATKSIPDATTEASSASCALCHRPVVWGLTGKAEA
jgi:drug/metabolite transporter (DMT)-like permease